MHVEFNIPSRGLIGLRTTVMNISAGEAIMAHRFLKYEPWKGDIVGRISGVIISHETGTSIPYAIDKLQDRGRFFIAPGEEVYMGQIVGENTRMDDLVVNVIREKQLTNMRASGSDNKSSIAPPVKFSLEDAMEYIQEDEYVELTPSNIRLRKILLNENDRKRWSKSKGG